MAEVGLSPFAMFNAMVALSLSKSSSLLSDLSFFIMLNAEELFSMVTLQLIASFLAKAKCSPVLPSLSLALRSIPC